MNILIPHRWLLDHLETDASPEEIAEYLSLAGPSVEQIISKEHDQVYDIEITSNRADALSVRGIAREAVAILPRFGKRAVLKPLNLKEPKPGQSAVPLPKVVNNPSLNGRLICIVLSNIQRTNTPDWMAERLESIEQNVHDSVIDITNYVTHDLGHPCHAFDYDKVMKKGGEIHIAEALPREQFMTLDGLSFETAGGEVVFKNGQGEIIDLPSIKGTANTSVDESTTSVLLLLESIQAEKVRFASMTHSIRTVAAQLMEKHIDPHLAQDVLYRACQLYQELCHAEIASQIHDEFPAQQNPVSITYPLPTTKRYLGIELSVSEVQHILEQLGCQVAIQNDQSIEITPPTYRPDISTPADIVEEIARIYGYHQLPSTIMESAPPLNAPDQTSFIVEKQARVFLSLTGWQEIYTYSMVSESLALESVFPLEKHIKIENPLSDDRVYMRRTLVPSLIEALDANPLRTNVSFFELAHVYQPNSESLPEQTMRLAVASRQSYRQVRGKLESLFTYLHLQKDQVKCIESTDFHPDVAQISQSAELTIQVSNEHHHLGWIGVLPNGVVVAEIELQWMARAYRTHPNYQPIAKTTPVIEDLTFTMPPKTPVGNVIAGIQQIAPEISRVELKSIYQNNFTFTIWYFDPTINMSNERVEPIRQQLVTRVEKQWQATLVGSI